MDSPSRLRVDDPRGMASAGASEEGNRQTYISFEPTVVSPPNRTLRGISAVVLASCATVWVGRFSSTPRVSLELCSTTSSRLLTMNWLSNTNPGHCMLMRRVPTSIDTSVIPCGLICVCSDSPAWVSLCRTHSLSMRSSKNMLRAPTAVASASAPRPMSCIRRFHVAMPSPPSSRVRSDVRRGRERGLDACDSSSLRRTEESAAAMYQLSLCSSACSCPGAQPQYPTNSQKSFFCAFPDATSCFASSNPVQ
mmetsp:Transcript_19772/g.54920  ORF Transcript_19772/g.54920 Transcript_19772/m.54920 type:complete len:251 (+) Transcript_19772:428-1180(+)